MDTPQEKGKKGGATKWLLLLLAASVGGNIMQLAQKTPPTTPPLPLPSPTAKPAPDPAAEYLTAAREAKKDPEVAMALYEAALAHSKDKTAILTEMTEWTKTLIEQDLKSADAAGRERAQGRFAQLASAYERGVASGSVTDIKGIPKLKDRLAEVFNLIKDDGNDTPTLEEQKATLAAVSKKLEEASTFAEARALEEELEGGAWDSSVEEEKDLLLAKIVAKQACLTEPTEELMIPEIGENTLWVDWLAHFADRLTASELSNEQKLEDLGKAAAFLEAATLRREQNASIDEMINKVDEAGSQLKVAYWKERVNELFPSSSETEAEEESSSGWEPGQTIPLSEAVGDCDPFSIDYMRSSTQSSNSPQEASSSPQEVSLSAQEEKVRIAVMSALLVEGEAFTDSEKESCKEELAKLNKSVLAFAMKEMKKELERMAEMEYRLPGSPYMQLAGAKQSQYLQMLGQIQELETRFPGQFSDELNEVVSQVKALEKLMDGIRDAQKTVDIDKVNTRKAAYLGWCQSRLKYVKDLYNEAEQLADKKGTVFSNGWEHEEVQKKLKLAWWKIMEIHPEDLYTVSPEHRRFYDELLSDIETKLVWKPTSEQRIERGRNRTRLDD